MTGIGAVVLFVAVWVALFAVLLGAFYVVEAWIIDPIDVWWMNRRRRAIEAERHRAALRDIDHRANRAVSDLSTAYQHALIKIRKQSGR